MIQPGSIQEFDSFIEGHNETGNNVHLSRFDGAIDVRNQAAKVLMRAFLGAKDNTYLNWLTIHTVESLYPGQARELDTSSEGFEAMVQLTELELAAAHRSGSVILLASLRSEPDLGIVGVAVRDIPEANGLWEVEDPEQYAQAQRVVYGDDGALEFDTANMASIAHSEKLVTDRGYLGRTIHNAVVGTTHSGQGVYGAMESIFNQYADSNGFARVHESSGWRRNDPVFANAGYERIDEHVYAKSTDVLLMVDPSATEYITVTFHIREPQQDLSAS